MGRQLAVLQREHRPQCVRREVPESRAERVRRSRAGARVCEAGAVPEYRHRRQAGKRYLQAGWRTRQQLHGRVRQLRRRVRSARQRGAQPGGHRGDRHTGTQQADPMADQLASALRSHRGDPNLQPHRRDHRHAHEESAVHESRRPQLRPEDREARHHVAMAADRSGGRVQLRSHPGKFRHHRQQPHPASLLRAAVAPRVRHVDGLPPHRAHGFPGGPVQHPRTAHGAADASDDQFLEPDTAYEAGRDDDRTCARSSRAVV